MLWVIASAHNSPDPNMKAQFGRISRRPAVMPIGNFLEPQLSPGNWVLKVHHLASTVTNTPRSWDECWVATTMPDRDIFAAFYIMWYKYSHRGTLNQRTRVLFARCGASDACPCVNPSHYTHMKERVGGCPPKAIDNGDERVRQCTHEHKSPCIHSDERGQPVEFKDGEIVHKTFTIQDEPLASDVVDIVRFLMKPSKVDKLALERLDS
jgi:hypothetical protein